MNRLFYLVPLMAFLLNACIVVPPQPRLVVAPPLPLIVELARSPTITSTIITITSTIIAGVIQIQNRVRGWIFRRIATRERSGTVIAMTIIMMIVMMGIATLTTGNELHVQIYRNGMFMHRSGAMHVSRVSDHFP